MSDELKHDFFRSISEERDFGDNWRPFLAFDHIFVPVGSREGLSADPNDLQDVMEFIDVAHTEVEPGVRVAYLFTDPERVDEDIILARLPVVAALRRLFKNEQLTGVAFNANAKTSDGETEAYTLYRFAVARLVGFVQSQHQAQQVSNFADAARAAHRQDQMYQAFHYAAAAREADLPIDAYFSIEMDVLLQLGLFPQAESYFNWGAKAIQKVRDIYAARLQSLSGEPKRALETLKPLLRETKVDPRVWLERGRALLIDGNPQQAIVAFDRCLQQDADNFDAILGKGIAIRALHYHEGNRDGLLQSLDCFQQVIATDGYHASEALHHAGTIHLALEQYPEAEAAFRQTLARDPSPVSKRNLSLVLHAQGRVEEGLQHFEYLRRFFPSFAEGLEQYYPNAPQQYVIRGGSAVTPEMLATRATEARERLRQWGITMRDDILDFRRFDSYVSYYAPTGEFLSISKLHHLDELELQEALIDCALHLAGILVRGGYAEWVLPETDVIGDFGVRIINGSSAGTVWNLFHIVHRRVIEGADADNLTNLEMLVSLMPEYDSLCREFVDPFPALPAEEERVGEFMLRAERACNQMAELGYHLTGELTDLTELELAIESIFQENGTIAEAYRSGQIGPEFIADLGLYLGLLCQKFTGGQWYDHRDLFGVSLQDMPIANLYPVWRLTKRIKAGPGGDGMINLTTLEPPLVCSELIRLVEETQLATYDAVRDALAQKLPAVVDEDPSESSLNRMAEMIWNYSGSKRSAE